MMLPVVLLSVALMPQDAPAPAKPPEPLKTTDVAPAGMGATQASIEAGLAAFKKHRFGKAEIEFRRALETEPQSAAANFYLGYTYYKIGEKKGRNNADKQKAKELFTKAFELDPRFQPVWGQKKKELQGRGVVLE